MAVTEDAKVDAQFGEFQAAMDKESKEFGLMGESSGWFLLSVTFLHRENVSKGCF